MAAVVHFSIWKTCKINTTYQEIDNDGSVTKCSSVYFNGGIADRRTYLYCRADYVLQSRNQDTRANKVSKSISKHENRTNRNTYQFPRKIWRSTICHKTSPLLALPTIWSYCCSVPGKNRKMQHLQWSSSHSTVSNKSSEFSNCNSKMCKLWRGTFSKQQQMSSFTRENADQNEQRNTEVTHYYQQTNTTISYIGEFPTIPTSDNRKKILTESLLKTGKSFAAISHVPRSVALAARFSMRKTTNMTAFESACLNQGSNSEQHAVNQDDKIISEQSLKQGSNNKPTEQQSLKQDNRKRSADQSLKSKEQIVREVVPTTNHSQSTADTAGTFDRIFTVLMTQYFF